MYCTLLMTLLICRTSGLNPFSDDDLFAINWAGPYVKQSIENRELITVQTVDNEKYHCVIPESQDTIEANRKASYNGPTPRELMQSLFTQTTCSYRIESYWTYELCHGKHIKQYHESKELGLQKSKLQEYYLGKVEQPTETKSESDESVEDQIQPPTQQSQEILSLKIDGIDLPYYSVNMTDGTKCDLHGKPRVSYVKYICQPTGRGEIYLLKETSSCEYDIVVLTAVLCSHPDFKPKDPPVSKIDCFYNEPGSRMPVRLLHLLADKGFTLDTDEPQEEEEDVVEVPKKPPQQTPPPPKSETPKPTNIGTQVDKQLLREFLNGDYCLHGGGGWWRHEFCFNRHAKQYHEEADSVTNIFLGFWDKQKHLDWIKKNPAKKPKPPGQRKMISVFYQNGDICDLTGNPRHVEVKLKCTTQGSPHSVSIYLVEPKPCEYILGVDSPIFCDLLDKADDDGLLENVKV